MAAPPAGAYKLDKSHASLVLRANHMGFSTYTTRFSRFDVDLTFDPRNLPASKVVTTIDASSFEMDAAPQGRRCSTPRSFHRGGAREVTG